MRMRGNHMFNLAIFFSCIFEFRSISAFRDMTRAEGIFSYSCVGRGTYYVPT